MSKHMGREKADALTNKFYHDLFPTFKDFVDHEAYTGIWLPSEFATNPGEWTNILRAVQRGMAEYVETTKRQTKLKKIIKIIKSFYERNVYRSVGNNN